MSRVARTSPLCKEVLLYRGVGTGGSVEWGHKINTKYETKKILQPISVTVRNLFFPAILCFFCFSFPVSEWVSGNFLPAYYCPLSHHRKREDRKKEKKKSHFVLRKKKCSNNQKLSYDPKSVESKYAYRSSCAHNQLAPKKNEIVFFATATLQLHPYPTTFCLYFGQFIYLHIFDWLIFSLCLLDLMFGVTREIIRDFTHIKFCFITL